MSKHEDHGGLPYVGRAGAWPAWWKEGNYCYLRASRRHGYIPLATTRDGVTEKAPQETYGTILRRLSSDRSGWVWSIYFGLGKGLEVLDPSARVVSYARQTFAHGSDATTPPRPPPQ